MTARQYLLEEHDETTLLRVQQRIPKTHRACMTEPITSAWYPEEALLAALEAMSEEIARGDDQAFLRAMEGCTTRGVNRLFSMLLKISSPAFLLKRVPTMWHHVRRGEAEVEVEQRDGTTVVHYRGFPYFHHRVYPLLTRGSLNSLVRHCTGKVPRVTVLEQGADHMRVELVYRPETRRAPVRLGT